MSSSVGRATTGAVAPPGAEAITVGAATGAVGGGSTGRDGGRDGSLAGDTTGRVARATTTGGGGVTTNNVWPTNGSDALWGYDCITSYNATGAYKKAPINNQGLTMYFVR